MEIQKIFKWASATFALIPGLAIIITKMGAPPILSNILLGGIVEATGTLTLILLQINKTWIDNLSLKQISFISITCITSFLVLLLCYIFISNSQIVYSSEWKREIFFPFWSGTELAEMYRISGNKTDLIHDFGPDAVLDAVTKSSPYTEISLCLFILNYVLFVEAIVIAFGVPGFRTKSIDQ